VISFLDPKQSSYLAHLNSIQERADQAQRQISSGRRMDAPSDDPDQIGVLLQSRSELAATDQVKLNLSRVKTEVDAAENALQNTIKAVERIRVLGSQGLTGTQSAGSRVIIANEVQSLLEQMVNLANTNIDGRYIFSGSADQTAPYALDLTTATGATPYAGGAATRQVLDASNVRLNVSRTGQELFDNAQPSRNVFAAVNSLRVALLANDESAIQSSFANIGTALEHLNEQLATYGSTQNQVADAITTAEKKKLSLQTRIAEIEDTDLAEAILNMQSANVHRQAALQAKGQEDRRTVFDFLR
jgi:flagellar hook-associated protein 3 FlgL